MSDDDNEDVLVFENIPQAVTDLILISVISRHVKFVERPSMINNAVTVTEIWPDFPVASWSSGERVMWDFIGSLSGSQPVSLFAVVAYFRRSGYGHLFVEAFDAVMKGE